MRPIRVLQLGMTSNYGGIEAYVMNLYRQLDHQQFQFDFVDWSTDRSIAYADEIVQLGGQIIKVVNRRTHPLKNWQMIRQLVTSDKYQVIYNNLNSRSYLTGVLAGLKCAKARVIAHAHNDGIERDHKLSQLLDQINRHRINRRGIIKVACSQAAGQWMFNGQDFRVVNNAIETSHYAYRQDVRQRLRRQLGLEGKLVIGSVARLSSQKNPLFLVELLATVVKTTPRAVLLIIGDGQMREELLNYARQLNVADKVKLMGMQNHTADFMQAMDVLAAPSIFEGFGISVLEAQCAGLPCVVSPAFHQDVMQTPLVEKRSLADLSGWVEAVLTSQRSMPRHSYALDLVEQGFDIKMLSEQVVPLMTGEA
ncbi:glycosyltransferase [Furfurilactobacillus curtus]|uniref:Glycosyltransferase EpsF n=1 Tax=Furfurilactobacillus curtus TaxID=1746200 RepID=A0ABQ5JT19_9LACO